MWKETAAAQAGILTRRQARSVGLSAEAIRVRLRSGRWQRPYPGVLATFSGPLDREAQLWAAVLACGPEAVLSHETAAELAGSQPGRGSRLARSFCGGEADTAPRLLAALGARQRVRWRRVLVAVVADVAEGCHSMLELSYLRRWKIAGRLTPPILHLDGGSTVWGR